MLTEKRIRDAKPGPKLAFLWDGQVKGLGVRITPAGAKSFVLRYRTAGKERLATLARVSEISLAAARERAGDELVRIRAGETDPLARQQAARDAETVADGMDRFFRDEAPRRVEAGRMKPSTVETYRKQWARTMKSAPGFGKLAIEAVTRADVERAIAKRAPVQRNRVLAFLSRAFTLFEAWELRPQGSNPCRFVEKVREQARDRVLKAAEIAAFARALDADAESAPAATAAVRVAALTGLRIGEVLAMEWEHIDLETGRVLLPDTKTGRRWHDLPDAVLETLTPLPRINAYCFTTGRDAPITYKTARGAFARAAAAAGLSGVRLHDLRRSAATRAAAAGLSALELMEVFGWKQAAMPTRYVALAGEHARTARRALGDAIAADMAAEPGKVIPLRRPG